MCVCVCPGTRYRRRGVDPLGKVANFVETEMVRLLLLRLSLSLFCVLPLLCVSLQILQAGSHHASYVLVRGSVPVFWTQPGTKYRPPPIIERGYLLTLQHVLAGSKHSLQYAILKLTMCHVHKVHIPYLYLTTY